MSTEQFISMERDHREICKFDSSENHDFEIISGHIKRMVDGAPGTVRKRVWVNGKLST